MADRLGRRRHDRQRGSLPQQRRRLLRRDRPAVDGRQPGPAPPRPRLRAHLRVRVHRVQADAPPAVDRRRGAGRDGRCRRRGARDLRLLVAGGTDRRRVPRGGAARPLRQHQLHGHRPVRDRPRTRLPGAGGAPEIAASAGEVIVIIRQNKRAFVERCDFVTSVGFGRGPGDRERLGLRGRGPQIVITDLGILRPDPETCELVLTELHPGCTAEQAVEATGWPLRVADTLGLTEAADGRRAGRPGPRSRRRDGPLHLRVAARPGRLRPGPSVRGGRRGRGPGRGAGVPRRRRPGEGLGGRRGRPARAAAGRPVGRGGAARPGRAGRAGPGRGHRRRGRRHRLHGRRLLDRPGQGARPQPRAAHRRRAHDLRRQRDDAHLRPDGRPAQADRQGPRRPAEGRRSTTPSSPSGCPPA